MSPVRKALFGRIMMGIVLAAGLMTSLGGTSHKAAVSGDKTAVTELQEVKLRKLHLVRPDLIMYPIAYEVFC